MKRQRYRFKLLAVFLFLLFLALALYGAWSVKTYGSRWFSYANNPRLALMKENTVSGSITDRNGIPLAMTENGKRVYSADSDIRSALFYVIGTESGPDIKGVETFHVGYLYGHRSSLADAVHRLTSGGERKGNDLVLTVSADLSVGIMSVYGQSPSFSGKNGAVTVVNYLTGEIMAIESFPPTDPDQPEPDTRPLLNRATQQLYPMGELFGIITVSAAMSDRSGKMVRPDGMTPATALLSADWESLRGFAELLDKNALKKAAGKFGFNRNFLFRDLIVANSEYPVSSRNGQPSSAASFLSDEAYITPMHMCLISAAIADNGIMREPYLLRSVRSASGGSVLSAGPSAALNVCASDEAQFLSSLMKSMVQEGTAGSAAAVPGLDIRGMAGCSLSADSGPQQEFAWFTGFCADPEYPYAVCVLIEDSAGSSSGENAAASTAGNIFSWIRDHRDKLQ